MGPTEFCRIGSHSSFVPLGNWNWDVNVTLPFIDLAMDFIYLFAVLSIQTATNFVPFPNGASSSV